MTRLRWVLAVSLVLNLFLLAFVGAQSWRLHHAPLAGESGAGLALRQIAARLPPADRPVLRRAVLAHLPALLEAERQVREAVDQVRADIASTPYDDAKLRADLAAGREPRRQVGQIIETMLSEIVPQLSEEGRKTLSEVRLMQR